MSEQFLTKQELAEILKVSIGSIENYLREGMPSAINHPPRFILSESLDWLKQRQRGKKPDSSN